MPPMGAVDIIIPTFKRHKSLAQTLASVQQQTHSDWTCWIAEDGETAQTQKTIKPFLSDSRFRYIPGPHTGIPAVPRNRAIARGQAPYIAFLDDDDLWVPNKLEQQIKHMEEHPDCVLLGSNAYRWPGTQQWDSRLPLYFESMISGKTSYEALAENNWIINSSAVIRRSALEQAGPLNESPELAAYEDYELWLRIGVLGDIWISEEPLVVYRDAPQQSLRSAADEKNHYKRLSKTYFSAVNGTGGTPSPLARPENSRHTRLCRKQGRRYGSCPPRTSLTKTVVKIFQSLFNR
ncbi:glycosyltransferase family 2 protein [Thermodesulfobacteriota bacterium]